MSILSIILVAVVLAVVGQLLVKHGINLVQDHCFSGGLVRGFLRIFLSPWVIVGTGAYAVSVLFWVYALTRVDLSFAYPFLNLSYVLIILSAWLLLGEQVSPIRWLGVAVICAGVILVSRT